MVDFPGDFVSKSLEALSAETNGGLFFHNFDSNSPIEKGTLNEQAFKIERKVCLYPTLLNVDARSALNMSEDEITHEIKLQQDLVKDAYAELKKNADTLQKRIAMYMAWQQINRAKRLRPVFHTHNTWQTDTVYHNGGMIRSNAVYEMYYRTRIREKWINGELVPKAWHVTWWIRLQNPAGLTTEPVEIAGQERLFKSAEAAEKYVEGRKKAYDVLFQEDYPPIPAEYANKFSYMGQLLPGYRMN